MQLWQNAININDNYPFETKHTYNVRIYLQPFYSFDNNFLLFNFSLHQHGPEVHASLDSDIEFEGKLHFSMIIFKNSSVVTFVIRSGLMTTQSDAVIITIRPEFISWFNGQVFEAFKPLDRRCWVTFNIEGNETIFSFGARMLVRWVDKLGLGCSLSFQGSARSILPILIKNDMLKVRYPRNL